MKAPRHWPLWGESIGHRWIPFTMGQQRGKCFHLMTSSCRRIKQVTFAKSKRFCTNEASVTTVLGSAFYLISQITLEQPRPIIKYVAYRRLFSLAMTAVTWPEIIDRKCSPNLPLDAWWRGSPTDWTCKTMDILQWRHMNVMVSNHPQLDCFSNSLFLVTAQNASIRRTGPLWVIIHR